MVTMTTDDFLSRRIPTFTKVSLHSRTGPTKRSSCPPSRARANPTRNRSIFSPIMNAGYMSSLGGRGGPLTTSGERPMVLVSKACTFSSFSAPTNVFPDIEGKLESETTVTIPGPPYSWSRMDPPKFTRGAGEVIGNWRTPILQLWDLPGTHLLYTS